VAVPKRDDHRSWPARKRLARPSSTLSRDGSPRCWERWLPPRADAVSVRRQARWREPNGVRLLWASRITTVWLAGLLLAANGLFQRTARPPVRECAQAMDAVSTRSSMASSSPRAVRLSRPLPCPCAACRARALESRRAGGNRVGQVRAWVSNSAAQSACRDVAAHEMSCAAVWGVPSPFDWRRQSCRAYSKRHSTGSSHGWLRMCAT
jgi:hypothetical protein